MGLVAYREQKSLMYVPSLGPILKRKVGLKEGRSRGPPSFNKRKMIKTAKKAKLRCGSKIESKKKKKGGIIRGESGG